ncbi:cupin domain-containing protein [candidate division KSB1 bacterium]|nr:cupin domain-containing protein [candidate division KSB1 bacterium]
MQADAAQLIEQLKLQAHPEGGYYNEIFASSQTITAKALRGNYSGDRRIYTSIYYLLESGQVSKFHRLASDELWYFHAGSSLTVHVITPAGKYEPIIIGPDVSADQHFQARVQAGCWFGASVEQPNSYALVGCMVAPGFEFADLEMADRNSLLDEFPQHKEIIERLTD